MPLSIGHGIGHGLDAPSLLHQYWPTAFPVGKLGKLFHKSHDSGDSNISGDGGMSVDQAIAKIHELRPQDAQLASRRLLQDKLFPGVVNITADEREAAEAISAAGRAFEAWVLRRKILHSELHNYYEKSMRCAVEVANVENKLMERAMKKKAAAEAAADAETAAKTAAKVRETLLAQRRHKDTLSRVMQRQRMFEAQAKSEQKRAAKEQARERARLEKEAEKADKELNSPRVTSALQLYASPLPSMQGSHRSSKGPVPLAEGGPGDETSFQDALGAPRYPGRRRRLDGEDTSFQGGEGQTPTKKKGFRARLKRAFHHHDTSDEEREAAAAAARQRQLQTQQRGLPPPTVQPRKVKKNPTPPPTTNEETSASETSASSSDEEVPQVSPECRNVDPSSALLHVRRAASKAYWDFDRALQVADRAVGLAAVAELQRRA
mmetsp:Transcript_28296/g.65633  ORF Transcript_28296/g.65633 Transcript_28296/m.65633 type:complete len:435 (+) Transcript_28296:91-1395(+)